VKKRKVNLSKSPVYEAGGSPTLYLTNNRSFQQSDDIRCRIQESKDKLKGKRFKTRSKAPRFCGSQPIASITIGQDGKKRVKYSSVKCKSWGCPDCQLTQALKAKKLIHDVILLNNLVHFLTLTLDPVKLSDEEKQNTHRYITKKFNHFLTILKRKSFTYTSKSGKEHTLNLKKGSSKLLYLWVIEFQQNGNAHMHILFNRFLPVAVIRKVWQHVGGGLMMHISKVRSLKATAIYVSGYIVKGIKHNPDQPSGFLYFQRRYSMSRSCIRPKKRRAFSIGEISDPKLLNAITVGDLETVYNTLGKSDYQEGEVIL
jgi:hypothetical protein